MRYVNHGLISHDREGPPGLMTRRRCAALLIGGVAGVELFQGIGGLSAARAADGKVVEIDDRLPFVVNANDLKAKGVTVVDNAIVSGHAEVRKPPRNLQPGRSLAVHTWHHNKVAGIVKVHLVQGKVREGVLQAIYNAGSNLDAAPTLIDTKGRAFKASGWVRSTNAEFTFSYDLAKPVEALRDIDPGKVAEGQNLTLLYQVPNGMTLTSFKCGTYTLELKPPVAVR